MLRKRHMLSLVIIWLMVIILSSRTANGEETCASTVIIKNPTGKLAFGFKVGPEYALAPRAIGIDGKGNIYIGDSVNYRVLKFDKKGKYLSKFNLQPPKRTKKPAISHIIEDISVDRNDNVYVINFFEYRVEVYRPDGTFLRMIDYYEYPINSLDSKEPLKGYGPSKITIDRSGNIYLFHLGTPPGKVFSGGVLSPDGRLLKKGVSVDDLGKGWVNYNESEMVNYSGFYYQFNSVIPDKKLPGIQEFVISIKDKTQAVIKKCTGLKIAEDEDGLIFKTDFNGDIYTFRNDFDNYDVIKINTDIAP